MERLRGAVEVDVKGGDGSCGRVLGEEVRQLAQRVLREVDVRVEQEHELAGRASVCLIDGGCKADVPRVADQLDPFTALEGLGGAVDRPVVDHDHLAGHAVDGLGQRVEASEHEIACVPVDDQDRDGRGAHSAVPVRWGGIACPGG